MSMVSLPNGSRPPSPIGDEPPHGAKGAKSGGEGGTAKGHAKTQCTCGKEGKHYSETALDATFPSTPEKIYNLMFTSAWFKTFLSENQKLKGQSSSIMWNHSYLEQISRCPNGSQTSTSTSVDRLLTSNHSMARLDRSKRNVTLLMNRSMITLTTMFQC